MPELIHDGLIDLATGRNRNTKTWKNVNWKWSALVEKLVSTHRTAETHSEYMSAKKDRQDEIKDIGGFVGGYLNAGRRKNGSVIHRQLITLDVDFATPATWEDFCLLYGCAAAVYSTHKHEDKKPRLRLIIPLNREVFSEEYQAIARRIAGVIDIEQFDHTTYQPTRLMYWPSTPKDGSYFFDYQDGPWLDADAVLATYHDWKDSSEWPIASRENKVLLSAIKKQGDPLEKPGLIGAFCRTHTITDAINLYLPDVYEACDVEDRFTFKEGSTSAGLVVYDDKYAFSHHGTDAISGKLCNAFDLVRLHKFGSKDEGTRIDTPSTRLPSYLAMVELATKDTDVRKLLGSERFQDAAADFAAVEGYEPVPIEEVDMDWIAKLEINSKGAYLSTIGNIAIILENDPNLKGKFALDEFLKRKVVKANLPWRRITKDTRYLKDEDKQNLIKYLEQTYVIANRANTKDAFDTHIDAHCFHPIKQFFDTLSWDGTSRVDTLFIDYMGAENSEYIRAVARKMLVAAISRIYQPGIKFETITTIIGPQGLGKSTLIRKIGMEWFSDSFSFTLLHGHSNQKAVEQLQGAWIIEIGELSGLKQADIEAVKAFVSIQEDNLRWVYKENIDTFKRQNIFLASSNKRNFLIDPSGNRRFWPVDALVTTPVKNVFTITRYEIEQIWAEALEFYNSGETIYLSPELEEVAKLVQQEHSETDERTALVEKYLNTLLPDNWESLGVYERQAWIRGDELQAEGTVLRTRVCAAEIWCEVLRGQEKDLSRHNTKEIHNIMRSIEGWDEYKSRTSFKKYGNQKGYFRVENNTDFLIKKALENGTTSNGD